MPSRIFKDIKIWKVDGFPIHLEYYDTEILVKDENGNSMRISKKDKFSIILDLNGNFKSDLIL